MTRACVMAGCVDRARKDGLCLWHWRRVQRARLTAEAIARAQAARPVDVEDLRAMKGGECRKCGLPAVTPDKLCRAHVDEELAGSVPEDGVLGFASEAWIVGMRRDRVKPGHCRECGLGKVALVEGRCQPCRHEASGERVHSVGPDAPRRLVLVRA